MTDNEAKGFIQGKIDCMNKCDVFDCKNTDECDNCEYCYSQGNFGEQKNAFEMAISALEEVRQLHTIGTVSEFRELKEKAIPKKIGHCVFYREMGYGTPWQCLTCGADQTKVEFSCVDGSEPEEKYTFCWCCGQYLDWSEGKG